MIENFVQRFGKFGSHFLLKNSLHQHAEFSLTIESNVINISSEYFALVTMPLHR